MRVTIPHLYDFGAERDLVGRELAGPAAWDAIRGSSGPFALPATREAWEERTRAPELVRRAQRLIAIARRVGAARLCSYGVGAAVLELAIAREAPDLELTCTDYAPETVERLQTLFPESSIIRHDLLADGPLPADLHLLHRIETEFSNVDLRRILARFEERVVVVPAVLLGPRVFARELYLRLFRPRATRAGWVRSEAALRALWAPTHTDTRVRLDEAAAFLLEARRHA